MSVSFYLRRYLLVFVVSSIIIAIAQFLKGHPWELAAPDGLLWGAISSAVYTSVLAYKLRNSACYTKPVDSDVDV